MNKFIKLRIILLLFILGFATFGCTKQKEEPKINLLETSNLYHPAYVKWYGRNNYENDQMYFYYTASGFEVSFYGTKLTATLSGTKTDNSSLRPYISVFVDGENNPFSATVISLDQDVKEYVLVEGLELGLHTVKVLKRSESTSSRTSLVKLQSDGHFNQLQEQKRLKFQIYGDSLTTGFGNLGKSGTELYRTETQDGLLTYSALAARMFDAEYSTVAVSGIGLYKSMFIPKTIPSIYDKIDYSEDLDWNPSRYMPDVILINLGANDNTFLSFKSEALRIIEINNFKDAYQNFLVKLDQTYSDAIIVCITLDQGEEYLKDVIIEVVNHQANNGLNVHHVALGSILPDEGMGSMYHPTYKTHIRQANVLAEQLETILEKTRVYQNIAEPNV